MRPGRYRSPSRDERGSATVFAAFLVAGLLCLTAAGVCLGSAVVARHRAQAAADLAALAGAERLPQGYAAACASATSLARQMRVGDVRCAADDLDIVVTVEVPAVLAGVARASARAGPVRTGPGTAPRR
nr:Rv3654c family TadE-like protein [Mycobacterium kiyosense]